MTDSATPAVLEERLRLGSQTMDRLERRIDALELAIRPRTMSALTAISLAMALGTPLATLAFAAGRYPDRVEVDEVRRLGEERLEKVQGDLAAVQREAVRLRVELEAVSAGLARVELKLGQLELALGRGRTTTRRQP